MSALFGPLAGVGGGTPGAYSSAPMYAGAARPKNGGQTSWWKYLGARNPTVDATTRPRPIDPAPPVRNFDTPTTGIPFGPAPAPAVVGSQQTRADRLFGPFAKVGSNSLAIGPGALRPASFPGL